MRFWAYVMGREKPGEPEETMGPKTKTDLIMEELLKKLENPKDWQINKRDSDIREHIYSDLVIMYYSGQKAITSPEHCKIPLKYQTKIKQALGRISHFYNEERNDFLLDYLRDEYIERLSIKEIYLETEIRAWLLENVKKGNYCTGSLVYFKSVEEAVLFKLKWG